MNMQRADENMDCRMIAVSGWGAPPEALLPLAEKVGDAAPLLVDWADLLDSSAPLHESWDNVLKGQPTVLLAWSLGGLLSLKALAESASTSKPDAIVLIGSFARFLADEESGWPGAEPQLLKAMTLKIARRRENVLRDFAQTCWSGSEDTESGVELFVKNAEGYSTETLKSGLKALASIDVRESLASIKVPTLVLHGESDAISPCEAGRKTVEGMLNAKFRSIPGGHAIPIAKPERITGLIHEFLNAVL
jgi:pimeloyl-[acyl-carrier protein] methyl ester esterase